MRRIRSSLCVFLMLILTATFLAPGFGWQFAGGTMKDAQASAVHDMAEHGMHMHADAQDAGHGMSCVDCDSDDHEPCGDLQHRCCPGHVLGHLASGLPAIHIVQPIVSALAVDRDPSRFSSRIPEGLERPPRLAFT